MNTPNPFQLSNESSREFYNFSVNIVSNLTPKKLVYLWGKTKPGESIGHLGKGNVRDIVEKCIQYLEATCALLEGRSPQQDEGTGGPKDKELQQTLFQTREQQHIMAKLYHIHTILSLYYAQISTEGSSLSGNNVVDNSNVIDNTLVATLQDLARLLVQEIMPRFQWTMQSSVDGAVQIEDMDDGGIHATRIAHKSPIQLRRDVDMYLNAMSGMQRFATIAQTMLHATLPYLMARAKLGQIMNHSLMEIGVRGPDDHGGMVMAVSNGSHPPQHITSEPAHMYY
jgi:hypothetical protein